MKWKLAPVEPTDEMALATLKKCNNPLSWVANRKSIYRDMLAAAPQPELDPIGDARRVDDLEQHRDKLLEALKEVIERMDQPPERNCSCHLSPPCNDCVDYGGIRESIKYANAAIEEAEATK